MISDDDIRRTREATDLVELVSETVVLRSRGREFWGRCPFHQEKTPSFKVDPRSQLYHCFGCHAGGDAYGFVMRTQNMEFVDAVHYLADRANITLSHITGDKAQGKRARLLELMKASVEYYTMLLLRTNEPGVAEARSYLSERSMGSDLAKRWQLGYAPGGTKLFDHLRAQGFSAQECLDANMIIKGQQGRLQDRFYERVLFPVADLQGRVIAFGGRVIGQREPKYLNTSETSLFQKRETLYAMDRAKASLSNTGTAIVVEGYTDTIAMHEAGYTNTVATLGTALTMQHLRLLNRFAHKVIYLFDGDEAGTRAAVRAAELITPDITPESGRFRIFLEVAQLPPGLDPADLLAKEGAVAMQAVLDQATPLIKFAMQQHLATADLSHPEGRNAALRSALQVLLPIRGSILAQSYIADELAPQLGADYSHALALFNSLPAPKQYTARADTSRVQKTEIEQVGMSGFEHTDAAGGAAGNKTAQIDYQNELFILFIEFPETRPLLRKAFERILWQGTELPALVNTLLAADEKAESTELYAKVLQTVPTYASTLSRGLQQNFMGTPIDYARLIMYMLREQQMQNEITLEKIAYAKADPGAAKDAHFENIAQKQSELVKIRERLAQVPKTIW
ncbi:MAG: DNA primase [Coriobacteriia bacterium]|nr:DNA primase [Coriobacteriia bacterium]